MIRYRGVTDDLKDTPKGALVLSRRALMKGLVAAAAAGLVPSYANPLEPTLAAETVDDVVFDAGALRVYGETNHPYLHPQMCGCVLNINRKWVIVPQDLSRFLPTVSAAYREHEQPQVVVETPSVYVTADGHRGECAAHAAAFPSVADRWEEFLHIKGNAFRPVVCNCRVVYWWDNREEPDCRVHHHVDHPLTARCEAHAALRDPQAHFDALVEDNRRFTRLYLTAIRKIEKQAHRLPDREIIARIRQLALETRFLTIAG